MRQGSRSCDATNIIERPLRRSKLLLSASRSELSGATTQQLAWGMTNWFTMGHHCGRNGYAGSPGRKDLHRDHCVRNTWNGYLENGWIRIRMEGEIRLLNVRRPGSKPSVLGKRMLNVVAPERVSCGSACDIESRKTCDLHQGARVKSRSRSASTPVERPCSHNPSYIPEYTRSGFCSFMSVSLCSVLPNTRSADRSFPRPVAIS